MGKPTRCSKCGGGLDPVGREGKDFFYFCRACKLPFNEAGRVTIDTRFLNSSFNPTRAARGVSGKVLADLSPVARTALEAVLIEALLGSYSAGLKDGILLAYSQDISESKPVVE